MEQRINLAQLLSIEKYSTQFSNLGSDYIFSRLSSKTDSHASSDFVACDTPIRVNGLMILLCLKGVFDIEINLTRCRVSSNMMLVIGKDSITNCHQVGGDELDAYLFMISPEFMNEINIDTNVIGTIPISPTHPAALTLSESDMTLMKRYFELIHYNTIDNRDALFVRSISRCLFAAVVYQMMQFGRNAMSHEIADRPLSRRSNYVRDFLSLVHKYHRRERSVAFYASQLYISPKYLSLIIKEATGKSAAEVIDNYVILEAKNLLRFSGKNVQQIAYELNFSNQSSFGKYFKHLTGMSPTEFQRS